MRSIRLTVQNFEKYPISVFLNLIMSLIENQQKSVWNFEATYIFPKVYNKFGDPLEGKTKNSVIYSVRPYKGIGRGEELGNKLKEIFHKHNYVT